MFVEIHISGKGYNFYVGVITYSYAELHAGLDNICQQKFPRAPFY